MSAEHGSGFGFWTTYAFTINFIVGVGILDMPKKFYGAGWLLSLCSLVASCSVLCVTMLWTVEALARGLGLAALVLHERHKDDSLECINVSDANHLETSLLKNSIQQTVSTSQATASTALIAGEEKSGAPLSESVTSLLRQPVASSVELARVKALSFDMDSEGSKEVIAANRDQMFAMNELLGMFCPTWTKTVYEVSIAMLLLMSLWAFTVVFSRSAVSKFSLFDGSDCSDINHFTSGCDWSFRVFVAVFGVVCISISLLDFKEMVTYQLILTIARFILIGVFVLVAAIGIWTDPIDNHSTKTQPPYISDVPAVNFSGFIGVFSTGLFAQLVNFGAPDLIAPMSKRSDGLKVMIAALVSTALMYALVGEACALYFGSAIESQVNVNFSHYRGGRAPGESVPWWASVIAYYAALFPAFDVLSMFPLATVSLSSTWRATLLSNSAWARTVSPAFLRTFCRLTVAVPPVLITFFAKDLDVIINYAVLPGAYIALVAPALLHHYSTKMCTTLGLPSQTPHSVWFLSGFGSVVVLSLISVALYVALVYSLSSA